MVAAFFATAIFGPFWGIHQLDAASNAQIQLAAAREDLDALIRAQLAEETGLRGFVATHERDFLDPDGPPSPDFVERTATLRQAVANVPGAVALVDEIGARHDRWEQQVALPLLNAGERGAPVATLTSGKLLTDELRASSMSLRRLLRLESDRLEMTLRERIKTTVFFSAIIVAIFALAAVALGLARAMALQRLQHEQSLVTALQQTLRVGGTQLPRTKVGFAYASATREALVGGDLLDSWRDGDHGGWFLIADVSGKGIQAARYSAFAQYAIRALAADASEPGEVIGRFNRLFLTTFSDPSVFVVLFLGRFDAESTTIRYASAGHSAAFVRRGRHVDQLPTTGSIVGLDRDETFGTATVVLRNGDTILLATDGLTEARDAAGDFLGDDGVAAILADAPLDPQDTCDVFLAEVERRSGGAMADDLAIIAIVVVAPDAGQDVAFTTMEAPPER